MEQVMATSMARVSFILVLLGVAAGVALALSAVGTYGIISCLVAQRRAEIGVRMALGAPAGRVARGVVLESLRLALAGVAIGLVAAWGAGRVLRSLLFSVSPHDPLVLGVVAVLLVILGAVAAYAPARRAARVDPVEVLRGD
jgi:putative ABC transport system permease protein